MPEEKEEKNFNLIPYKNAEISRQGWIWLIVILLIIIIWGVIGEQRAEEASIDCNFGIEDYFCWFWEENVLGEIEDEIDVDVDSG